MKVFSAEQTREIDRYTITNEPIASVDLMERAAFKCSKWIIDNLPKSQKLAFFVGTGNNGGDGLAMARQLYDQGYTCAVYIVKLSNELSPDSLINLHRLKEIHNVPIKGIRSSEDFPEIQNKVCIDCIFGSGLSRPIEGFAKELVEHINAQSKYTISIDIPSGLFCDSNTNNDFSAIIQANVTLTFQFPKLAFFFPEYNNYVGKWQILPIGLHPEILSSMQSPYFFVEKKNIAKIRLQRNTFAHKGTFGHALIIAGSYGKIGAALLATKACIKSGCGLVTTHIPSCGTNILQTALPEAMLSIDNDEHYISCTPDLKTFNAIAIGPGLDQKEETYVALKKLLQNCDIPMVIDADALNIISSHKELLELIPKNSILTPHPKEFERLAGQSQNSEEQLIKAQEFAQKNELIIVLKGAYTRIVSPDGKLYFNPNGNSGMATAGSGDVLTGIIVSLLAQKYPPKFAALLGVFIHGSSGDFAAKSCSEESLIASDIIAHLGKTFLEFK